MVMLYKDAKGTGLVSTDGSLPPQSNTNLTLLSVDSHSIST